MFKTKYRFAHYWKGFGMPQKKFWWWPFWFDILANPTTLERGLEVISDDKKEIRYENIPNQ